MFLMFKYPVAFILGSMEGRHVWALYLVMSRRGLCGSVPNLRWVLVSGAPYVKPL